MRTLATLAALALSTASALAEIITREVAYSHDGTQLMGFLAYDDAVEGPRPGILIIHEWWGQTDYARSRARRLAELGYVAFAVDMYGQGKTVSTPDEARTLAMPFYQDRAMARARITAALDTLREQEQVDDDRIAAIGYCFGGTIALELARSGADVRGVVSFHGGLGTPTPEDARNIKGKVFVATGAVDPMVKAEEREAFVKEMEDAKVDYQMILYGGAVHSFTNPDAGRANIPGVAYQQEADHRSWRHMRGFFDEIFSD
jgi:dienelactone hydrolase